MKNLLKAEFAADLLRNSKGIIITSGAGIGVDSGLPDFRGDKGFWNAYPMYEKLGISFVDAANPRHFSRDPEFGWGFYGHRLNLYRQTVPNEGFRILLNWIERFKWDYFSVTSNVDGHFQKAGFQEDRILEVHGSIHHLQCTKPCCHEIWQNDLQIEVNEREMRVEKVPICKYCQAVSRPNILMFGDYFWIADRTNDQESRFSNFLDKNSNLTLTIIEIGAGTAVPTIRYLTENTAIRFQARIIRINPRESMIAEPHLSLACGGLEGLSLIDDYL